MVRRKERQAHEAASADSPFWGAELIKEAHGLTPGVRL